MNSHEVNIAATGDLRTPKFAENKYLMEQYNWSSNMMKRDAMTPIGA
jgi:hypothetical protein